MSIRKNSYEQKLVNRWQRHVSRHEAEEFLLQLRKELYNDSYHQIRAEVVDGAPRMPRLPKWAKDAFNGKMPYTDDEMQDWADKHRVPVEAVKIFGMNHHYLNEFRKMCEGLDEYSKERLCGGDYIGTMLEVAEDYDREPGLWIMLSKCSTRQLETLGEWAEVTYAPDIVLK